VPKKHYTWTVREAFISKQAQKLSFIDQTRCGPDGILQIELSFTQS
jgi:hypothetical protein